MIINAFVGNFKTTNKMQGIKINKNKLGDISPGNAPSHEVYYWSLYIVEVKNKWR
jgi:hypothetical protein